MDNIKWHYYNTVHRLYENRLTLGLVALGAATVGAVIYGAMEGLQDQVQPDGQVFDPSVVNQ